MAHSTDIELQGVTAFETPPAPSFRYTIALKDDKLSIWMEDCISKKQWYKGGMKTSDYTSSANSIPDASASDYVKCFQDALECDFDKKSEVQRKITALKDGVLRLELVMSIRFIRSSWDAKYVFDLDPVSVERIDILESKLRDYRDELEKLRGPPTFANLEAATKTSNSVVIWDAVEEVAFIIPDDEGVVTIVQPGVYHVVSMINCSPGNVSQLIQLLKNGEVVQQNYCGFSNGNWISEALDAVVRADEGDKLTVTCYCNLTTSYLSVTMLGK